MVESVRVILAQAFLSTAGPRRAMTSSTANSTAPSVASLRISTMARGMGTAVDLGRRITLLAILETLSRIRCFRIDSMAPVCTSAVSSSGEKNPERYGFLSRTEHRFHGREGDTKAQDALPIAVDFASTRTFETMARSPSASLIFLRFYRSALTIQQSVSDLQQHSAIKQQEKYDLRR